MRYEIRIIRKKARCERLYQPVVKAEGKKFRNARNERPLSHDPYMQPCGLHACFGKTDSRL
jgi:hypothetical protein